MATGGFTPESVCAQEPLNSLRRTESQVQKQNQVQDIFNRLGSYSQPIAQLKEEVSRLAIKIRCDIGSVSDARKAFESCRKNARNHGEDLLEDTLALDRLTGLFAEDRLKRKESLAKLDAFLEEVDRVKSDLVSLDKELNTKLAKGGLAEHCPNEESTDVESPLDETMSSDSVAESPHAKAMSIDGTSEVDVAELESPNGIVSIDLERHSCDSDQVFTGQPARNTQLQEASLRIGNWKSTLHRLNEKVLRLETRLSHDDAVLVSEGMVSEDCEKHSRHLYEDVLEDVVVLDGFSDLTTEERVCREKALSTLQEILDNLDKTKSRLALLKKGMGSKLIESKTALCEPSDAMPNAKSQQENGVRLQQPQTCMECGKVGSEGRMGDTNFEGQWFCLDCWTAWNVGSIEESASKLQSQSSTQESSPKLLTKGVHVPPTRFWEQLELPLQAEVSEEIDRYVVTYRMRNLQANDVDLQLNDDASQLKVSGVHLPSAAESKYMQQHIARQLSNRGLQSCDVPLAMSYYASIGDRKFGRFSDVICLPPDVNAMRISACCNAGALLVTLPKHVRQTRPIFTHPFFR